MNSPARSESRSLCMSLSVVETCSSDGDFRESEPLPLVTFTPKNHGGKNRPWTTNSPRSNALPGKCLRRSPKLTRGVPLESSGLKDSNGVSSVSSRKSGGKKLLRADPPRRSPRLASLRGEFVNVDSVAAGTSESKQKGKFLRNKRGKVESALVKSEGSECRRLTFKGASTDVESLGRESLWDNVENSLREFASKPVPHIWKDDDGNNAPSATKCCNQSLCGQKQLRRSPRFITVMENGISEERFGGFNKRRKKISGEKPSRRSLRLSVATENGRCVEFSKNIENHDTSTLDMKPASSSWQLVEANGNSSSNKALKKSDNDGLSFPGEKPVSAPPGFAEPAENDGRDDSLSKTGSHDLTPNEVLTSALKFGEAIETIDSYECLRKFDDHKLIFSGKKKLKSSASLNEMQKNCDIKQFDTDALGETHMSSDVNELSDSSDEEPNKKIKISVENLHMKILNGKISRHVVKTGTRQTEATEEDMTSIVMVPSKSIQESSLTLSSKAVENKSKTKTQRATRKKEEQEIEQSAFFLGDPISLEEAQERWRWRYELKNRRSKSRTHESESDGDVDKIVSNVECHYSQAKIKGCIFSLGDCAHIKGEEVQAHVGKILEFFKTTDGDNYFRVQWFYRAEDTVMKQEASFHDRRRLFYSSLRNDNPIGCIISKVSISQVSPMAGLKPNSVHSDYYFDMEYCVEYSTFRTLKNCKSFKNHNLSLSDSYETTPTTSVEGIQDYKQNHESDTRELALLDLYSGCGGMSTGLCLGAKISGVDLVTKWAVDVDRSACESLKINHPETHVRNDAAGDFLKLLKEWEKLCKRYVFSDEQRSVRSRSITSTEATCRFSSSSDDGSESHEFEVEKVIDVCYGDPSNTGKHGLKFKVHWKGYSANEDSWEPAEGLSNCQGCIRDFVRNGFTSKILPLPGDCDVICGGPPCQGISGYNRHRHVDSPLTDERNRQIIVFMDIVGFLRPKFVLMENVVDILRFDKGSLGRYALSRLVHRRYQARLGIMAAGSYGLAQFRLRVFLLGADPNEKLPSFPLPTHDVIFKYGSPLEFERNIVAYDEGQPRELEKALVLEDAISDLPSVTNDESREKISYESPPDREFQRYIRSTKHEMTGCALNRHAKGKNLLYDHRPSKLFEDDYVRVCQIPKRKGANFRDLPGLIVGNDGVVRRDPAMMQVMLPSGKPLLPDYVFTFEQGRSKKPFGRLWWDEIVPTVITCPSCRNQVALHPEQDRMLTIREYARFQGFPDYYRFSGTVKERYCQVGNAVAVSVSRALGYALGMAFRGLTGDEPLVKLPLNFSHSNYRQLREIIPK